MDNKKNDSYYFSKILEDIDIIKKYFKNATHEQFLSDSQLIENTKSISTEFKSMHPDIKWSQIIRFRSGSL